MSNYGAYFINESGLYSLILSSKLPNAKKFKRWVTSEVLPAIRKTGAYAVPMTTADKLRLLVECNSDLSNRMDAVENSVGEVKDEFRSFRDDLPLLGAEMDQITSAVKRKGVEVLGGKESDAYHDSSLRGKVYADIYQQIKREMKTDQIPAVYDFIGNAGFIPKDHWVHDEAAGGGRILGEACHFVDLIQYLDGSELTDMNVTAASNNAYPMNDNVLITLKFASGAVGSIVYSSMGSKKYPKEQLRVLSNGSVYEMDNFIRLKKYGSTKTVTHKLKQDKGIKAEYEYICQVLKGKEKNTVIQDAFRGQELLIKAMNKVKTDENAGL